MYSGNSVHLRIYPHVLSISTHIRLILCTKFAMPSIDFLWFINALMRLISTVHCMLEPKRTKRFVQTMNICNPWLYWYILVHTRKYAYILVHTRTYSYILSNNTVYFESGWIRLAMTYCRCCTLVQCIAHSILPFCGLFDVQASQAGLAAPKLPQPRFDLIDIAAPLQPRRHSHTGSLNPCACWICGGLLESSYQPETVA